MTDLNSDADSHEMETRITGARAGSQGVDGTAKASDRTESLVNHYETLNLQPGATRLEVREMYLRMKATYGAGSSALYSLVSEEEASRTMALVEEAFRVLGDTAKRREYDKSMGFSETEIEAMPTIGDDLVAATTSPGGVDHLSPDATAQAERLATLRGLEPEPPPRPSKHLPIVQLKAIRAGSEELDKKYAELVDANDLSDGDLFRQLRQAANVSEEEMQERTKVCRGYIRDIEENRFERLPPIVYVKGFLRSIFKYLGVPDSERLVSAYAARLCEWQETSKT